jgi:hypothetical protein
MTNRMQRQGDDMRFAAMKSNSAASIVAMPASLLVACTALFALAGCEQSTEVKTQTSEEFEWARAALQRNPALEVVAADTQAESFTVKVKRTGVTQVIKMKELAAAPVSEIVAAALAATPAPGYSAVSASTPSEQATPSAPATEPETTTRANEATAQTSAPITEKNYTIQRNAGQLKVSGPGVSIVSAGPGATATAQRDQGERTVDPVICEGKRMLHFDNRNIYVDGNAIVARGGCELFITNSRVISSGTAVVASDSIVHIANSTIEGTQASFDAGDGAKMYLRSSTFLGLPRRAERSVVQDQGGNTWR